MPLDVTVSGGRIRGREDDGVELFAGIPYAAAPVGELRWRSPQLPEAWTGVRPAVEFGSIAPQSPPIADTSLAGDPVHQSEDCLSLNIWTASRDGRRPVMVWIHGGSFTSGTGGSALYNGSAFARDHDVVVVTLNYRLGALGFLAHSSLFDDRSLEAEGNWGLLDQLAALRWVHDHIDRFGGDPGNVTLFGESAGAMSVSALLGAPSARGLFHKVILESGPPYTHSRERAEQAGNDLAKELGIGELSRRVLESVPAADLVAATRVLQDAPPNPGDISLPFLPVVDGRFLPRRPQDAVAAGEVADLPLLLGTNRDEMSLFTLGDPTLAGIDEQGLVDWLELVLPGAPVTSVISTYRQVRADRGEPVTARDLLVAIGSDLVFRFPSLQLAASQHRHQPQIFTYLFTWETPVFGGVLGACHGLEMPFVFGTVRNPAVALFSGGGPDAEALADRMQPAWAAFAHTGNPSHPGIGTWPSWDPDRRATMVYGPGGGVVDAPRNEELTPWEEHDPLAD